MSDTVIAIVIVLYHPKSQDLEYIIDLSKKYAGVIVDNSEMPCMSDAVPGMMQYITMGGNKGIAAAQNAALEIILKEETFTHVIFLDQDSRLPMNYPSEMAEEFENIKNDVPDIAALGPTVVNNSTGEEYHSAIHKDKYVTNTFILRNDIISSGCCMSTEVIRKVGMFDKSLFIDFVDTEWCFRAKANGFVYGVTPKIMISHKIGKGEVHIGPHIVSIAEPFRYYYQYRNFIMLLVRGYVPMSFKINFGIKFAARFVYLPFCVNDGFKCWKNMIKGITHGINMLFKRKYHDISMHCNI